MSLFSFLSPAKDFALEVAVKLWFNQQGTDPDLNLKFYLYHS